MTVVVAALADAVFAVAFRFEMQIFQKIRVKAQRLFVLDISIHLFVVSNENFLMKIFEMFDHLNKQSINLSCDRTHARTHTMSLNRTDGVKLGIFLIRLDYTIEH